MFEEDVSDSEPELEEGCDDESKYDYLVFAEAFAEFPRLKEAGAGSIFHCHAHVASKSPLLPCERQGSYVLRCLVQRAPDLDCRWA